MERNVYVLFEKCVAKIFEESGFSTPVNQNAIYETVDVKHEVDFVFQKDGKTYCVEVKSAANTQIIKKAIERVCNIASSKNMTPIFVTAQYLDKEKRNYFLENNSSLILIDIANLLYAVRDNAQLRNELIALLPYSVDEIEPEYNFIDSDSLRHDDHLASLIRELNLCDAGREDFRKYEELCIDILKALFSEDLTLWHKQQKSNKGLYRFDLLCRVKDGTSKSFWSIIESYFHSKYLVFEFKNYSDTVTQNEIYTTERYLYAKALRSVAIIVSANGYHENAKWAAKGCLRENGKLIILLTNNDLIEMLEAKNKHEDPSEHLQGKLDALLIDLEK